MKNNSIVIWTKMKKGILPMMVANVLSASVQMISNIILVRLLTKTDYGIINYAFNYLGYAQVLMAFGLLAGAYQFGTENVETDDEFRFFNYCLKMGTIINVIITGAFLVLTFFLSIPIEGGAKYARMCVPLIVLEYMNSLFLTVLRCEARVIEYAHLLNINTILVVLGVCTGAVYGLTGVVIGKYLAFLLSLLITIWKLKNETIQIYQAGLLTSDEKKQVWTYSIHVGAAAALNSVLYRVDVSMIAQLVKSADSIALYKAATLIPTALYLIPNSVIVAILPDVIRHREDREWLLKFLKKVYIGLGVCNIVICSFLALITPQLVTVIMGRQYIDAVPVVRVLVIDYSIGGTFRSLSVNILSGFRKTRFVLGLSIVAGLSNILLDYIFVNRYDVIGAAYATFGVVVIASMFSFPYLLHTIRRLPKHEAYV